MADLEKFVEIAERGLSKNVENGDYEGLVEIMGHLMAVKERQTSTNEMFEPLKQTIELLKIYEQELPGEVYKQLEVGGNMKLIRTFQYRSETLKKQSSENIVCC